MQSTQKPPANQRRFYASPRVLCILGFVLTYLVSLTTLAPQASAAALSAPGGNVADPVVRQVDIARPAVVRIITTENGQLTVHFSSTVTATFPQSGGFYSVELAGSGAFISAHGDLLTADHVINPPKDQGLDDALFQMAAQDVADFINSHAQVTTPYSASDAYSLLASGAVQSSTTYSQPTSEVYLSTSYVGIINAAKLETVPAAGKAVVDRIEAQSSFTQNDVAIIHVSGMDNMPSIQLDDSSTVAEQDNLTIIGYPGLGDLSKSPTNLLTSSINKIYVSALKTTDAGAPVIQVGGNVEHGDSGGPALDESGHIVGIVSFGYSGINGNYGQTAFLQASSSALTLIKSLNLDLAPGAFEKAWTQAIDDYASASSGHWQTAASELQNIAQAYPNFLGVSAYLNYAKNQAGLAQNTASSSPSGATVLWIVLLIVLLLVVLGAVFYWIFRRNARPAVAPGVAAYPSGAYQQQSGVYGPTFAGYNPGAAAPQAQSLPGAIPVSQIPGAIPLSQMAQVPGAYPNYTSPAAYGALPGQVPQTPRLVPGDIPQTPQPVIGAAPLPRPVPAPWQSAAFPLPAVQTPQLAREEEQPVAPVEAQAEPENDLALAATAQVRLASSTSWPALAVEEKALSADEKTVQAQFQSRSFSVPRRPGISEAAPFENGKSAEATVASPFTWVAPCGHTNAPDVRFCRVCGQPVAPTASASSESNGI